MQCKVSLSTLNFSACGAACLLRGVRSSAEGAPARGAPLRGAWIAIFDCNRLQSVEYGCNRFAIAIRELLFS